MKKLAVLLMLAPNVTFAFCFEEAGQHYNVSPKLLKAIATVESSLNPNAYNENKRNGKVVSRDFGLMQINSTWFNRLSEFNVNEKNVYEPCFNVSLGAWVLSSNFASHGHNWNSVGAYNAGFSKRTENARRIYIQKVKKVYYDPNFK
ncbi:lytic transglycosylase domain-containing protein [Enterovibrio norvegicus]|uniref:Lytic transglycosylase domain-containing protein n=1 Tax=Enterovibrio norvegicus TaxID=188144 RepID=A0ABV4L7X8_9GAMM